MEKDRQEKQNMLLNVQNLSVSFEGKKINPDGSIEKKKSYVVDGISFALSPGEILGIVGESGSGKSMTALALMGLLKKEACRSADVLVFDGTDLNLVSEEEYRALRGRSMSMIFQEPMTSLNPVYTVGAQVEEMLKLHSELGKEERKERVIRAFAEAGIREPEVTWSKYPHQLSGGQRQRVMIAMAMICEPKLLIADEPTTALDVTIQARILELIRELNREHGTAVILISHDLGVIRSICDRTLVMHGGRIVEHGHVEDLFERPREEYTKQLLAAVPGLHKREKQNDKKGLSESRKKTEGKETFLESSCAENDPEKQTDSGRKGKEHLPELLSVRDLTVTYEGNKETLLGKRKIIEAVSHIDFDIYKGEILGLVGESGCGKSTTAKALAGLLPIAGGKICVGDWQATNGTICAGNASGSEDTFIQRGGKSVGIIRPQMVFQDPYSSLNPAKRVGWILEEPLKMKGMKRAVDRVAKAKELLTRVGLSPEYAARYPKDLSGGQRQRVAIAAALITEPKLLILDEPVSALDVTVQAQILDLLLRLRKQYHLTYLFISHDMNVIYQICDRVCVMTQGRIVETATPMQLLQNPQHDYTKKLLAAVPSAEG